MWNEAIYFFHLFFIATSVLVALRWGRVQLAALMGLFTVFANLFVTKEIVWMGLHITTSDVYVVGFLLGMNLMQEFFGKESAKQMVPLSFFLNSLFALHALLHLSYTPSPHDATQAAFSLLLLPMPRILLASVCAFFVSTKVDVSLFAWLKEKTKLPLFLRSFLSMLVSQGIDTLLFTYIGLFGLLDHLEDVLLMSYSIKVFSSFVLTPFTSVATYVYRYRFWYQKETSSKVVSL